MQPLLICCIIDLHRDFMNSFTHSSVTWKLVWTPEQTTPKHKWSSSHLFFVTYTILLHSAVNTYYS